MGIKCKINGCDNPVKNGEKYCNRHICERDNKIKKMMAGVVFLGGVGWKNKKQVVKFCKNNGPKIVEYTKELAPIVLKKFMR